MQKDITENAATYLHQRNTNLTDENTVLFAVKLAKLTQDKCILDTITNKLKADFRKNSEKQTLSVHKTKR